MTNKYDNDDFFGEELKKRQEQNQQQNTQQSNHDRYFEQWQNSPQPNGNNGGTPTKKAKAITITLISVALVVMFILGFLCAVFFNNNSSSTDAILNRVLQVVREQYYQDISEEQWEQMIASGGTAMLNTLDPYSHLLTPQQAYDFFYAEQETIVVTGESFGINMYLLESVGVVVQSTVVDSSAYGKLFAGDILLKATNITPVSGQNIADSVNFAQMSSAELESTISKIKSATFSVLRSGDIVEVPLTRSIIGQGVDYKGYDYVEYYVKKADGSVDCNISTQGEYSTKALRGLDNLDSSIGYIRIKQFDGVLAENGTYTNSASLEFAKVMNLFKKEGVKDIIIDLKGNPGGYINMGVEIAGMLVNTDKLTQEQKNTVTGNNNQLLIGTLKGNNDRLIESYYVTSTYNQYFDNDGQIHIVVWADGNSASCSELLLGALLDYQTAIFMGTKTYGKGIAQTTQSLGVYGEIVKNDGTKSTFPWTIYFTLAKYYSPLGDNIHGVGYTPVDQYKTDSYTQLVSNTNAFFAN